MPVTRSDVEFPSGGLSLAAWLYRPDADSPVPIVVMAHGFSGTRDMRLDAYADRGCRRRTVIKGGSDRSGHATGRGR